MDELLREGPEARDLSFSALIRVWKAFASHKTLRMSPGDHEQLLSFSPICGSPSHRSDVSMSTRPFVWGY